MQQGIADSEEHPGMRTAEVRSRRGSTDGVVLVVFALLAIGFGIAAVRQYANNQRTVRMAEMGRYNASPDEVIGRNPRFLGGSNCPFTLVEFGDYQCGPCRATIPKIKSLLNRRQKDLRFVFRDLPLTSIHPLAMRAAVVAETAGTAADYWSVHDELYSAPLDESMLDKTELWLRQDSKRFRPESDARRAVRESMAKADSLGISGTPTFVLVCPGGIVRRVSSLDNVEEMVKSSVDRARSSGRTPTG